ncbi:hypothetical protein D3C72_1705550 [compost metagenome]
MATDQAGREVTQGAGAEPQAHHLPAHSFWGQQGHSRQTNRAKAQFAEGQHQNTAHQPHRRDTRAAVAEDVLRRQHHQAKARRCAQNTDNKLGHAAWTHAFLRHHRPGPAKDRCQQDDKQGVDRLEPHGRDFKIADHAVGVVVRKQVE